MNPAETFVYTVCRGSFLTLWSYINPKQEPRGKELCDILVVCEPDVIIFSVKQVKLTSTKDPGVDAKRWTKKAIDASVKQIYGAEKALRTLTHVVKHDDTLGVTLPKAPELRIHRVAVALGSQGRVPLPFGDFGKGFVHVFDELSFTVVLRELDTITDFATYLIDKERFFASGKVFQGIEEDLLALYLYGGRKFPSNYDVVTTTGDLWQEIQAKPEYIRRNEADKDSYVWDGLIEIFCRDILNNNLEFSSDPSGGERAIRVMATENRFSRRILGKSYREFLEQSTRVRSRQMRSPSGVVYVFLALPPRASRDFRVAELGNRCFVARGQNTDANTVVGIATEQYKPGQGFSLDLCCLYRPEWSAEDQKVMLEMQKDLGYFVNPQITRTSEDEYPLDKGKDGES